MMFDCGLQNIFRLKNGQSRSINWENRNGEKGKGGMASSDLGPSRKGSPCIPKIEAGETVTLGEIQGEGIIQHIWITVTDRTSERNRYVLRDLVLRMYWDGEQQPSVECPVGDFFASGWGEYAPLSSLAVCVNPGSAFNCYWPMPFRRSCRMTMENRGEEPMTIYYQIDYTLTELPEDTAYFHAQFRRVNPLPYKQDYTILDHVRGKGQYVGTYLAWGVNNTGWWGEGEIKFFLDGDGEYPTVCGTGTEDYFCGSYNFENQKSHRYETFSTPYSGLHYVSQPDGVYQSQQRFGMYRWHIMDPVRFDTELKVTIQALGWREGGRYLPLQDDIASVAYWYQTEEHSAFPELPDRDTLEVI